MALVTYRKGDATLPPERPAIVAHVCNDKGGWGSGFVRAVSDRFGPKPEACYRAWASGFYGGDSPPFELGEVQFVPVEFDAAGDYAVLVANMLAQAGYCSPSNPTAVRYPELECCLSMVSDQAVEMRCAVHVPRIGCGLGGGDWNVVEGILLGLEADVVVYDRG